MALAIADFMADGQVFCVAVAAIAQGLDVFQRRRLGRDMFAADPARHDAMELPRDCFIHLDPQVCQSAHGGIFMQNKAGFKPGFLKGAKGVPLTCPMSQVCRQYPIQNHQGFPMKGDAQVISYLQAQLKNELTAINQYFVHYRMYKHWGLGKLAKKEYEESIGEMKHADRLMERLFMLDALPNLQDLGKLMIGEDVLEAMNSDLKLEVGAQATVKEGMAHCESVRDYVSRDLLQDILDDTEEHIDFLETQIELAAKVGIQNYLQSQMGELG